MPNDSLEHLTENVFHYLESYYDSEYPPDHKYDLPARLKEYEKRVDGYDGEEAWYNIDTESIHDHVDRLNDEELFTSSTFLGHILNPPTNKLNIPSYQRDYSWDDQNNLRYWIDIITFLRKMGDDGIENERERYMGSAYVSDESNELEVIDGQQRLISSLTILLNIKEHLELLEPEILDSQEVSPDFRDFFEYFIGDDFLEEMLYPTGGQPVLSPNEKDEEYFGLIFAREFREARRHLENIDTREGRGGIGVETLLIDDLGYSPHELEALEERNGRKPDDNLVQKKSNRLLKEAYDFYRIQTGSLVDYYQGVPENRSLKVNVVEVNGSTVTLQTSVSSEEEDVHKNVPVGNVDVYVTENGETTRENHQGSTDYSGKIDLTLNTSSSESRRIVLTNRGERVAITYSSLSELEPRPISVVEHKENRITVCVRNSSGPVEDEQVEINGEARRTNADGTAIFDLLAIEPEDDEDESVYTIEALGESREFSEGEILDEEYSLITHGEFNDPAGKARILMNLVFVLLHSLRIVYAEFGIPNKQYKIDIFQSLNDRGEDLTIPDLIRARIIAKGITEDDSWSKIYDRFDGDAEDINNFLKQFLTAKQSLIKPDNQDVESLFALHEATLGDADSILNNEVSTAKSKLQEVEAYSQRYEEITKASLPDDPDEKLGSFTDRPDTSEDEEERLRSECETLFEHLNQVGSVWEPVVLSLYYDFSNTSGRGAELNKILKTIVKIIYRYAPFGEGISSSINRTYMHKMSKEYNDRNLSIHNPDDVRELFKQALPDELEIEEVARRFVNKRNWTTDTLRNIYTRHIDIKLSSSSGSSQYIQAQFERNDETPLTIEHTFPSSLGLNESIENPKSWIKTYFDPVPEDEAVQTIIDELSENNPEISEEDRKVLREKFVNDIGNTMPLARAENSSVSDRLYSKKLAYYFLVGKKDMKKTDEYHYTSHESGDVLNLLEMFMREAEYDDIIAKAILGLLVEGGDSGQKEHISGELIDYDIGPDEIESMTLDVEVGDDEQTVKALIRNMMSQATIDESKDSVPDTISEFNDAWNIEETKDRKSDVISEILETLAFEGEYDENDTELENFGIDLEEEIDKDYSKRVQLR